MPPVRPSIETRAESSSSLRVAAVVAAVLRLFVDGNSPRLPVSILIRPIEVIRYGPRVRQPHCGYSAKVWYRPEHPKQCEMVSIVLIAMIRDLAVRPSTPEFGHFFAFCIEISPFRFRMKSSVRIRNCT